MKRKLVCVPVLVIVTAVAFLGRADEADLKTVSTDKLIARLGSDEFSEREQASKALQGRGPSVLPELREATKHKDAEVRRRVKELIPILETIAAVAPKRVTLTAEKRPLSAILKDIEKQTGYSVEEEERDDKNQFVLEMKGVPFWEALERIRRETGCVIITDKDTPTNLLLKRSKTGSPFVSIDSSFRVSLTQLHEDRDIDFQELGKSREFGCRCNPLRISVSVLTEPALLVYQFKEPQIETADEENGHSLKIQEVKGKDEDTVGGKDIYSFGGWGGVPKLERQFDVHLQRSPAKTRTIKELHGSIPVQVITRKPILVTDNLLQSKGTKCQVNFGIFEIVEVNENEGKVHVKFKMPKANCGFYYPVWVTDEMGNRFEEGNSSRFYADDQAIGLDFCKPADSMFGLPKKLFFESRQIQHYSIPFVFKDVPLP